MAKTNEDYARRWERTTHRVSACVLVAVAVAVAFALISRQASARSTCEALQALSLPEAVVISATDIPAGPLRIFVPGVSGEVPAICRVTLRVEPQIYIEVWLPRDNWNKRFRGEGGGGAGGWVSYNALIDAVRAGYAAASTDTGHPFYMEASFVRRADGSLNQQLVEDFAWRSLYEMARKAKALINSYYGAPPQYSYWNGCSTGGRQGLMAVQRFPEEYDGVLAGSPAIHWDRFIAAAMWPYVAMQQQLGHPISEAKLSAATEAAVAWCDDKDGVVDGVINDPRACHYDPAALVCSAKSDPDECLTPAEAHIIRDIWEGPKSTSTGARLWFGLERGAPLTKYAVPDWRTGLTEEYFKFWIRLDPTFEWRKLSLEGLEQDIRDSYATFNNVLGTDDPNLRGWKERGGKLMIWHDDADAGIPPRGTLNYFERVVAANGGRDEVSKFARLYMVPGSAHCGTNPVVPIPQGPQPQGMFDVLVKWVEQGVAPDRILAAQPLPDGGLRTRPLCPYPDTARWSGRGNSDNAENFTCVPSLHKLPALGALPN